MFILFYISDAFWAWHCFDTASVSYEFPHPSKIDCFTYVMETEGPNDWVYLYNIVYAEVSKTQYFHSSLLMHIFTWLCCSISWTLRTKLMNLRLLSSLLLYTLAKSFSNFSKILFNSDTSWVTAAKARGRRTKMRICFIAIYFSVTKLEKRKKETY